MAEPITVYGAIGCEDTARARAYLKGRGIPFRDVTIDHDKAAYDFVVFINNGSRSTPTVVFGGGKLKTLIAEPSNEELTQLLTRSGY